MKQWSLGRWISKSTSPQANQDMIHMLHDRLVISRAKVCQMPRTNGYWALWLRMLDTVSPLLLFVMDPWISMQDWPWKLKLSKNQTPTLTLQSRSSRHTNPQCPMQYIHMMYTLLLYSYIYMYIYLYIHIHVCVCIWRTASVEVHLHHCTAC